MHKETNDWQVTIDNVLKVNVDKGDTLIVTLPAQTLELRSSEVENLSRNVGRTFESTFYGKDLKVIVVPHGMEVQLIKTSELKDGE